MKHVSLGALVVSTLLIIGGFAASGASEDVASPIGTLPVSLDNYYPPKAQGPAYLMAMHELATPFSGFVSDMMEGDMANAQANFEKFQLEYIKVSKMVPEWAEFFPLAPVDEAAAAITSGDQGKIMAALERIGKDCHGCHIISMPMAQHKYHWGDFTAITATDPLSNQSVPFAIFMQMLDADMTGIDNDLSQGQLEAAVAHAKGLAARFGALKETCDGCHDTAREYFVDDDVMGMIAKLELALAQEKADPQAVGQLVEGIGMESCYKCHLVHIPAAYSKHEAKTR
jgi:hypothetical protein